MTSVATKGALATLTLSTFFTAMPHAAQADPTPTEPEVETTLAPTDLNEADDPTPVADPTAPAGASSCRAFTRWEEKVVSKFKIPFVGTKTIDVFRQSHRPAVCENDSVLTHIYGKDHECKKYSWGLIQNSTRQYVGLPSTHPNTTNADGEARCGMKIGGEVLGVEMSLSKMIVQPYAYRMNGKDATGNREAAYVTSY